jgi:hypothetical protein
VVENVLPSAALPPEPPHAATVATSVASSSQRSGPIMRISA